MTTLSNLLDRSSRLAEDSKSRTLQDIKDAIQAIRIVDTSKGQAPTGPTPSATTSSQASSIWIQEYFERKFAEMESRVETYRRIVEVRLVYLYFIFLWIISDFCSLVTASFRSTFPPRSRPDQSHRSHARVATHLCSLSRFSDRGFAYRSERDQAAVQDTAQGSTWDFEGSVPGKRARRGCRTGIGGRAAAVVFRLWTSL
jgi:hypothetical protein